jgi:ribosomal protein S14
MMNKCSRCGSDTGLVISGIPMCPKCLNESAGLSIAKGDKKQDASVDIALRGAH